MTDFDPNATPDRRRFQVPPDPPNVSEAYVERLLASLVAGPIGQALLDLAEGKRRIRIKQHRTGEGWVVTTEEIGEAEN